MATTEHYGFNKPNENDFYNINGYNATLDSMDAALYNLNKLGGNTVYPIDISKVGSGNNILWVDVPGVESYDDLDGKMIAVYTGTYCCQWNTPQTVYINVNGKGSRAIRRPLPSNGKADYDTKQYYTDKYVKGEISRYQTLLIAFSGTTVTLLNPAPPARATQEIAIGSTDEYSYVTPSFVDKRLQGLDFEKVVGNNTVRVVGFGNATGNVTINGLKVNLSLTPQEALNIILYSYFGTGENKAQHDFNFPMGFDLVAFNGESSTKTKETRYVVADCDLETGEITMNLFEEAREAKVSQVTPYVIRVEIGTLTAQRGNASYDTWEAVGFTPYTDTDLEIDVVFTNSIGASQGSVLKLYRQINSLEQRISALEDTNG